MAFDSVIHRVLCIPGGAGFLPSTIFHWIAANLLVFGYVFNLLFSRKLPLLKHTLAHPSASSTHKKQVNWERLRPCRWDFNASQSEIWVVVDVMMTCGMQIIHNHHVSTIHAFFQHMGEYLGNKLLDLLGYSLLGVLTPMFPLSYKLFVSHLTWKMAIHNLIIFITHLKISHVENKVPFKFLLFQQKKTSRNMAVNLETSIFHHLPQLPQHVGKPIFQLSTPKEKI